MTALNVATAREISRVVEAPAFSSPAGARSAAQAPTWIGRIALMAMAWLAAAVLIAAPSMASAQTPELTIDPEFMAAANLGVPYSQTVVPGNGAAPFKFAISSGSLPTGLSLNEDTGEISGTPTATGTWNFRVFVIDSSTDGAILGEGGIDGLGNAFFEFNPSGRTGSRDYSIVVTAPPHIDALSPNPALPAGGQTVFIMGTQLTTATSVKVDGLETPFFIAGFNLRFTSPPGAEGSSVQVVVTTPDGTDSATLNYASPPPAPSITGISPDSGPTAGGTLVTITGTNLEDVTGVGFGEEYYAPVISASPTEIQVETPEAYNGEETVLVIASTSTQSSSEEIYFNFTDAPPPPPTLTFDNTSLMGAAIGSGYNEYLSVSGGTGPYTFSIASGELPAGLTLSETGVITGAATATGTFNVTIQAIDSTSPTPGSVQQSFSISVEIGNFSEWSTSGQVTGTVGQNLLYSFTVGGGTAPITYSVTAGALPSGVTLETNGTLQGAPTVSGEFNFTIKATDSTTGDGPYGPSHNVTLTVDPVTPSISMVSPGGGSVTGNQSIVISGGGFYGVTAVNIGGEDVAFTVDSPNQITATTPSHAPGSVDISVTADGGVSNLGNFTYFEVPVITSITPNPAAAGATVTISGSGFTAASTVDFGAAPATFSVVDDVGSSRVDLQACKLEYSIVSPK